MIVNENTLVPYPNSHCQERETNYYLAQAPESLERFLCVQGDHEGFEGQLNSSAETLICALNAGNAAELRERLPWLKPKPLGLATSFGFGDRLGSATPGHIAATQGSGLAPVFAQQSVRENDRTGRTPQIVLDDAMWGVFQSGWHAAWGADADHVKEIADLPPFLQAFYSFYTIDPGDHVDNEANSDPPEILETKIAGLPWGALETHWGDLQARYAKPVHLAGLTLAFDHTTLLRAVIKYGRAIAHSKAIYDHLAAELGPEAFDLEISVDETDTPTSVEEHYFIAAELRRLGVGFVSLAPRFIGDFEKGVDYIGDVDEFDREMARHAAVMHTICGYKISVHTGSDKFSIYPSVAAHAKNLAHVKTAGTSYLEALRVAAAVDPALFREILALAHERYEIDRATYHVSAVIKKVPQPEDLSDNELAGLFEQFDAREALHVTYGSALDIFGERIHTMIGANQALYDRYLQAHFERHLAPFRKV